MTFRGILAVSITAAFAASPILAGQVSVINPSIGSSVSVAPSAPSVTVAPVASGGSATSSTTNGGTVASNNSISSIGFQKVLSDLVLIDIKNFSKLQVNELIVTIENIERLGILSDAEMKLLSREKQRLLLQQR